MLGRIGVESWVRLIGTVLFFTSIAILFIVLTENANGATTVTGSDLAPSYIKASSNENCTIGLIISDDAAGSLVSVNVTLTSVSGFSTSDLAALSSDQSSGVQLWQEDGTTNGFQKNEDTFVACSNTGFIGSGPWAVNLTLNTPIALPSTPPSNSNFYIIIRTSGTISNGDQFNVRIATGGVSSTTTPEGTVPSADIISSTITADTNAPTATLTISESEAHIHYPGTGTTIYFSNLMSAQETFTIEANPSDGGSGVSHVVFSAAFNVSSPVSYYSSPYIQYYGIEAAHSSCTITISVYDNVGNQLTLTVTCTEDTTPPAGVTLVPVADSDSDAGTDINPDVGYDDDTSISFSISGSISDTGAGVPTNCYKYKLDSGSWTSWTSSTSQAFTVSTDGTHTAYLNITDNVGNVLSTPISANIVVDRDKPTGTFSVTESPASPYIYYNSGTSTFYYSNMMGTTLQPFLFIASFTSTGAAPQWKVQFMNGFNQTTSIFDDASPFERLYAVLDTHTDGSLVVVIYDRAGNSQSLTMTCVEDTTPPSGYSIVAVADSDSNGGNDIAPDAGYDDDHDISFACSGSITETESGLPPDRYSFRLGAGAWTANGSASTYTFTVGSDGSYTGYVRVIDNVGNFLASPPSTVIISDINVPVGTFSLVENPSSPYLYYNGGTTTFYYSALMGGTPATFDLTSTITNGDNSGAWKISFSAGFDLGAQTYVTSSQTRTYGVTSSHSTNLLTIIIYNHAGNSATFTITCVKDTTPPSGYSLVVVADSDSHGGNDIAPDAGYDDDHDLSYQISGSITETESGLPSNPYTYRINGGSWSSPTSSAIYTYSASADGIYTCEVCIIDNVGNFLATYQSATIISDTDAPAGTYSISESSPYLYFLSGTLYYSNMMGTTAANFDVTATFTNAGNSNEWKVYFSVGFNRGSVFSDSTSPYTCTYGVLASHTTPSITVTLFNHAGNSLLITITCTEDLNPPTGLLFVPVQDLDSHGGDHIDPDIGYDDDTTISFTVSALPTDALSGLPTNYISYRLNGGSWSSWTSTTTKTYTSADGVTDGTYTCEINVTDNVGNYLNQSATIIVDTTTPTGSVTIVETPSSPYIFYNSGTGIFYYSDMMGASAQNFELQATFTSPGVSLAWKVNFSIGFNQNTIFSDDSSPYSRVYGVTSAHSTNQIYAILYNHAGNAVRVTVTCIEDTVAPSGYSIEPIPDADSDGGIDVAPDTGYDDDHTLDFRVTGTITETSSGLPTNCYSYKLNTGSWSSWGSSSTVQYTVASDGTYTCYVNVTDNVGNVASLPLCATLVSDTAHPIASYTLEESPSSPYLYYNAGTQVFFYSAQMGATPQPFYLNASFDALGVSGEWYVVYSAGFDQGSTQTIYNPATYSRIYSVINTHSTAQLTITLYSHSGNAVRLTITCTKDTTPPTGFSIAAVADADSNGGDDIAPNTGYDDDSTIIFQITGGSDASSGLPTNRYSYQLDGGSWSSWGSSSTVTYTSVSDGTHTCNGRLIDNVGNIATAVSATITVDTNPPTGCTIQISESASHIYLNATTLFYTSLTSGESFTITATFGNPSNSLAWKVGFSAGFDRTAFEDTSSPFMGTYTIQPSHTTNSLKIVFYNNAGNSMSISLPCVKDSTPPTLTFGTLQNYYKTSIFTVSWSATDNAGGSDMCEVQRYDVEYNDNGAGWVTWKSGTMQTSDTFTGWNGHTYTFRARARDNVNNTCAYVTSITTMIDTSLPTSSINPLPQYTNTHEIYVSWNASDPTPGSGIYRIYVQVRIDDGPFVDWFPAGVTNNSAIYYGLDGHRYYFQCIAVDNATNSEIYPGLDGDTNTFVDTLSPLSPSLNYPEDNPSYVITSALGTSKPVFSWTSQDDPGNSGIGSSIIEIYSNSNPSVPILTMQITHSTPSTTHNAESNISLEPGNYTWRVCDIDKAGNVGSWSSWRRFRIDARPSVVLTSPQINNEYNGNLVITWLAMDPDADNLGTLSVSVYYNTAPNSTAPGWILIEGAQTDGTASWNTLSVPDGSYYIMLVVNDTILDNNTVSGPFIIKNYNITLIPDEVEKFVDPGSTIEFAIHAHNFGTVGYVLALTLGDVAGWAVSLSVQSINIQPGNDVVFILYATAPTDSLAGDTAYIQITGTPEGTGGAGGCSVGVRAVVNQIENVSISPISDILVNPGDVKECLVWFENTGNGLDSFRVSASNDLGWNTIISNGTTVGPIGAHEKSAVLVSISVPSNAFAYTTSNTTIRLTSAINPTAIGEIVIRMTVRQVVSFSVTPPANSTAGPHTSVIFTFYVHNTGNGYDVFEMTPCTTAINSWHVFTNSSQPTAPGNSGLVTAEVVIPPNVSEGISDTFMATIRSQSNGTVSWEKVFSVTVTAGYGVIIQSTQKEIELSPGQSYTINFDVFNAGNIVDSYTLTASTPSRWNSTLSQNQLVNIQVGQKGSASLTITAPQDGFAGENATIALTAVSYGANFVSNTLSINAKIRLVINMSISAESGKRANPNSNTTYNFTITNTGNGLETFQIIFENSLPGTSCIVLSGAKMNSTTGKYEISIAMHSTNVVTVELLIPSSASGQDILTISISSKTNPARTLSATITTLINQAPIPQITSHSEGSIINACSLYLFNSTASDPENDAIVSYFWDFGDGTTYEGQNAEHQYSLGGRYTISLTATDALGRPSTIRLGIIVNSLPTIAVLSPKSPSFTVIEEHSITFKVSTFDQEGDELTYIWTIDGKNAGNGKSLKYTPQMKDADKTHLIKLTVSDPYSQVSQEWNVKVMKDSSLLASRNIWIIWLLIAISFCIIGGVIVFNNRSKFFTHERESVMHTSLSHSDAQPGVQPNEHYQQNYQDGYNNPPYTQDNQSLVQAQNIPQTTSTYPQGTSMQPSLREQSVTPTLQSGPIDQTAAPKPISEPKAKRGSIKIVKEHVEGTHVSEAVPLPLTSKEDEVLPDLPDIDELIQLKTAESVSAPEPNADVNVSQNAEPAVEKTQEVIGTQQSLQTSGSESALQSVKEIENTHATPPSGPTLPAEKVEITSIQEPELKTEPQIEKQEYESIQVEEKQPEYEIPNVRLQQSAENQTPSISSIDTSTVSPLRPIISEKESETEQAKEEYSLPVQLIKIDSKPQETKTGLITMDISSDRFQAETDTQFVPQKEIKETKKSKPKIVGEVAPTTAVAVADTDLPKAKTKPMIIGETKTHQQEVKKPKIVPETTQTQSTQTQSKTATQKKIEIKPIKDEKQNNEKELLKEETKEINKSLQSLLEECNSMLSTISTYQTAKDDKKNEKKL